MAEKRSRRPNFNTEELKTIADEVSMRKPLLFGKLSDVVTNEKKTKAWKEITVKVNAVSLTERTYDEIRKKWIDWSSAVKVKAAKIKLAMNKTGSGSMNMAPLTSLEEKVISIIGIVAVEGFAGAVDSFQNKTPIDITCREDPDDLFEEDSSPDRSNESSVESEPVLQENRAIGRSTCRGKILVPPKKRKLDVTDKLDENALMKIEKERLDIEKERLSIEKERLRTETQRLETESRLLDVMLQFSTDHYARQDFRSPFRDNPQGQSSSNYQLDQFDFNC